MKINNEKELIEMIQNKTLEEIKEIFLSHEIHSEKLNYFKETVMYLIKENISYDIIKFIFHQQQKRHIPIINNTELLFYSLKFNNFKIAKLLLRNNVWIENINENGDNIIEYLIECDKLNSENLLFILKVVKNSSLITADKFYNIR
ncbi:hypothetical protein BCR32DRAFT_272389 [Anaeromyces robustus]|uniref:Ankyrin n=1 Tax=Anaeromyces robustus TaxID=1754192 RepID=A0A1Y1WA17_9FUNG|nr:hypothetical protein BCR32DRAFT_272389 [Anaeromyces robustus]|eukprot:ORX70387.1 hypothetical protein BCR32DRAFT_272389 [Anaeromyces robustus]